jgi:hypothetical protein
LHYLLTGDELAASLAVDAADYYATHYSGTAYLDGLRVQEKDVETKLANVVKAVMAGAAGETITSALNEPETRKAGPAAAIAAKEARHALADDAHSVQTYFARYWRVRTSDEALRGLRPRLPR